MNSDFTVDMAEILSLSSAATLLHEVRYMQEDILESLNEGHAPESAFQGLDNAFQSLSQVQLEIMDEVAERVAQIAPQEGAEDAPGTTED